MSEHPPQSTAATPKKAWYMKWWVWLIVAVVLIGLIGQAFGAGKEKPGAATITAKPSTPAVIEQPSMTPEPEATKTAPAVNAFDARFTKVCNAVTSGFKNIGSVTCQDATTWQTNHDRSPDEFPNEYRDVNVNAGQVSLEIKVVADASKMDYFRADYTCDKIFGGEGSCVIGEAQPDTLFSVIIDGAQDDAAANQLAETLKHALEGAQ